MRKRHILLIGLCVLLPVFLAACGIPSTSPSASTAATAEPAVETAVPETPVPTETAEPEPTEAPTPEPPQTAALTEAPTAEATETAEPEPSETAQPTKTPGITENKIGLIMDLKTDDGKMYIAIDYVEFLGGKEGIERAKEENPDAIIYDEDGEAIGLYNDYFISNQSKRLRTFEITKNCDIKIIDWTSDSLDHKKVGFKELKAANKGRSPLLVDIRVKDGVVVKIIERYTP